MNTTAGKITTVAGIGAALALALFFFLAVERGSQSTNPQREVEAFVPPVYGVDGDERFLTLPLFFDKIPAAGLSAEQKQKVADFKKHILARAASKIPLKATEKSIIIAGISTDTKQDTDGPFVIGQDLLQFTEDELRLISNALQE